MSRRKAVLDLFVRGREALLPDGTYLYIRAMNSFEREEAIDAGQVAKARLIMALKENGTERLKIEARLEEKGQEFMARELAAQQANDKMHEYTTELQDDPEWKEKLHILLDSDPEDVATPMAQEEVQLLHDIQQKYFEAVTQKQVDEEEYLFGHFTRMDREAFLDEYVNAWLERKGGALARAEYELTELYLSTRVCNATPPAEGEAIDHSTCGAHEELFFESRQEARKAPDDFIGLLREVLLGLSMSPRDPKDSPSPESSSASPQSLSEAEVPKPST